MAGLVLTLDQEVLIKGHCLEAFPEEACGLLLGYKQDDGSHLVRQVVPCPNVAPDPLKHFEVDPARHLRAQRDAREKGLVVLGHYHSHPNNQAEPSTTDRASILDPQLIWLIVASRETVCETMRAFRVVDGPDFVQIDVNILV